MRILTRVKLLICGLLSTALLITSSLPLLAQSEDNSFTDLPLVDPTNVPLCADFYYLSTFGAYWENSFGPPLPWSTCPECNTYYLGSNATFGSFTTNAYVVDDTGLAMASGPGMMTEEDSSGDDSGGSDFSPAYSYPSNYLYLIIDAVSNNTAFIRAMNTVPDQTYELLSRERLLDTNWTSEGTFIGAEEQDWTPTTVAVGTRTNSLFLSCRSWVDEDGDGLPSWWEMQYGLDPNNPDTGNTGIPDGYKNPAGDGWNNLYKYEHGMNPNSFYTPPPPRNIQARLDSTGTNVVLTWESGGGPVSSYGIESDSAEVGSASATTLTFTHHAGPQFFGNISGAPAYQVRAYFSNGSHADSQLVTVTKPGLSLTATLARGQSAQAYLAVQSPPPNLSFLRIYWPDWWLAPTNGTWLDIYPSNLVNGITQIPGTAFYDDDIVLQAFATNGDFGETFLIDDTPFADTYSFYDTTNFINAAAHLKANLEFLLRSATTARTFSYLSDSVVVGTPPWSFDYPEQRYVRQRSPTNYEYYGYHSFSPHLNYSFIQPFRPVMENYLWRNFVFDGLSAANGASLDGNCDTIGLYRTLDDPFYSYSGPQADPNPPLAFSSTNSTWLLGGLVGVDCSDSECGVTVDGSGNLFLASGTRNCYGLPFNSVKVPSSGITNDLLYPGIPSTISASWAGPYYFPDALDPGLQRVDFYFASQTPYFRYHTNAWWYDQNQPSPPLPGSPSFSNALASLLLITGLGQPITVSGWAKMAITNGYSGRFAYLEQYWDKAYKTDTNGAATTNQTGLLSPYGEFFPTEPGQAALVTMPDIDTGQRGTGIVNVIKLQLDVNHDGVMDLTFGGPDNTSPDRPFAFWVNDDYDRLGNDGIGDDFASTDRAAYSPYTSASAPDCEYRDGSGNRIIPHPRDLEDFARLWLAGITTNLFASLPAGVTAELSWGDKGNPNPNNPTIDIFGTANVSGMFDSGSGIGYLSNSVTAWAQSSNSFTGQRLGPGDSIPVVFTNSSGWQAWNRAIWCGVQRGTGALTLTFTQGTNKIAETSAYIQVKDIKEMYERWTVGDVATMPPTNRPYLASDGLPTGTPPFRYGPSTDTNTSYILLVHDYDLPPWKKNRWAETAFKRLYWHGYQGRFGLFCWPGVTNSAVRLYNSESNAWASATGLLNLITNLNAQYSTNVYLIAHGYGAVAAGEALRLAGTNLPVNTYIALQGAVPSRAYDFSAPVRYLAAGRDSSTPDCYRFYNGSACYFAGVGGAGTYINYFNTNDVVLTNRWCSDQDAKCDPFSGFQWDGVNFYRGYHPGLLLLFPQDRYEIFSYADEARSQAIGAQPNLGGPFAGQPNIDLAGFPHNFKDKEHSAEFLSDCADRWEFWHAVLTSMGLKP